MATYSTLLLEKVSVDRGTGRLHDYGNTKIQT